MAYEIFTAIEKLSGLSGVSGREESISGAIIEMLPAECKWSIDPIGSLLVFKKGKTEPKKKVLLCAHMDEVGFIVTNIDESGFLRFDCVGGIDSRVAPGKAVEIGDRRVPGVIGSKSVHHQDEKERSEVLPLHKLYIDIGASNKLEAAQHVSPGDRIIFSTPFISFGDGMIMGKALDDRAGCAVLLSILHSELEFDCVFAFTVQEEIGCIGAVAAGYTANPDISIVVETTTAADVGGVDEPMMVCRLGFGPALSFMDKGAIYDRDLYDLALKTAKDFGIKAQSKLGVFGGNDSRSLQTAKQGSRVLAVSMPCRYIHSPANVLKKSDVTDTVRLLKELLPALEL